MRLLQVSPSIFFIPCRNSRTSVVQYRKRRSLLKDYRVLNVGTEENVYAKLDSSLEKVVPINPRKTSITIDILGEETYPELTNWRKRNIVERARRVLPLPISLVTDDKLGYVWKQCLITSLRNRAESKDNSNLLRQIPSFVKILFEQDPSTFKERFPELYSKYSQFLSSPTIANNQQNVKAKTLDSAHFPFDSTLPTLSSGDNEIGNYIPNEILDEEYESYLKHHDLLQFLASNLSTDLRREYKPEIEGWASQVWLRQYGKADPTVAPSQVPCSGCGAHLHCVANNIPGFMPVEKFTLFNQTELRLQLCQRCEFLKRFNVALNITVSTDEYPDLISKIQTTKSLVIILVDLLDFPCSVWPGIINLIGEKHKVYIVGNKVDLLPKDDKLYLERIKLSLKESLKLSNISKEAKIRDISLISAKTGYGVENLVTKMFRDRKHGEDVYLIGCTNAGKSTLFNALMQSDLCALRDNDLMSRATTSLWPGTTLNLLKFPLNKLEGWAMQMRLNRLNMSEKNDIAERRLNWTLHRQSNPSHLPLLSGRISSSFRSTVPLNMQEEHPMVNTSGAKPDLKPFDPNNPHFKNSNFLHDTPGVIYKDQLLNLLTTEELLRTLPRQVITPRTYTLRPGQTLFLGGLARVDLGQARQHVWFTVFASHYLPVHIVYTEQAKRFYETYLGTDILAVPLGDEQRLSKWPKLLPREFSLDCLGWEESCADVVLSSAGWISVTGGAETTCILRAFTPEARGIYLRTPPALPYAIRLRGKRIPNTPCFENKLFTIDQMTEGTIPKSFFRNREERHISNDRLQKAIRFIDSK